MIVNKLEISGFRVFEHIELEFQPGMNLIVGVNGAGKSTILYALCVSLSKVLPNVSSFPISSKLGFWESDIRSSFDSMKISCDFDFEDSSYNLLIHKKREQYSENKPGVVREQTIYTPDFERITPNSLTGVKSKEQPLCLFFSTRRSLVTDKKSPPKSAKGGQAAAYFEALSINRDFNIREIAEWMKVQSVLGEEEPKAQSHLTAFKNTAEKFLSGYKNLHIDIDAKKNQLLIDKKDGVRNLSIKQLSDGERGMLSLALDLARRLLISNPKLEDPISEGKGIILIDELDLHLHPKWQRMIIKLLTQTFQNCQFIVTSHSPQIIGEVNEENIIIISENFVHRPSASFGIDSSRILEEIMGTNSRSQKVKKSLEELFDLIEVEKMTKAKAKLIELRNIIGSNDPDIIRAQTLIDFLEES